MEMMLPELVAEDTVLSELPIATDTKRLSDGHRCWAKAGSAPGLRSVGVTLVPLSIAV
jgi:hypothetical protein